MSVIVPSRKNIVGETGTAVAFGVSMVHSMAVMQSVNRCFAMSTRHPGGISGNGMFKDELEALTLGVEEAVGRRQDGRSEACKWTVNLEYS